MKIHHTTESKYKCGQCGRTMLWLWKNAEEKNGHLETLYGFNKICLDCKTANNNGRPPLGLKDLNEIRKRGITKDQYYKEHGYK